MQKLPMRQQGRIWYFCRAFSSLAASGGHYWRWGQTSVGQKVGLLLLAGGWSWWSCKYLFLYSGLWNLKWHKGVSVSGWLFHWTEPVLWLPLGCSPMWTQGRSSWPLGVLWYFRTVVSTSSTPWQSWRPRRARCLTTGNCSVSFLS